MGNELNIIADSFIKTMISLAVAVMFSIVGHIPVNYFEKLSKQSDSLVKETAIGNSKFNGGQEESCEILSKKYDPGLNRSSKYQLFTVRINCHEKDMTNILVSTDQENYSKVPVKGHAKVKKGKDGVVFNKQS